MTFTIVDYWAMFSGIAFLCFAIPEAFGLFNKVKGDTFSESIRNFFHTNVWWGRLIWCCLWGSFAVFFFFHIAFGWL